ncbi:unnamed protein product, partial [Allacma fusca]
YNLRSQEGCNYNANSNRSTLGVTSTL